MNSRLITISLLIAVVSIGYLSTLRRIRKVKADRDFAEVFLSDLNIYGESQGADEDIYVSLTRRSNIMQNALGSQGILARYKPPGANYMLSNVPVVLNMLPQLHNYFSDEWLRDRPIAYETYCMIRDAILRHIGTSEEHIDSLSKDLCNPFIQLRLGVEMLIMAPLDLLSSFGIISASRNYKIHQSAWTQLFAGIVSLITLVSGAFTIIVGWPVVSQIWR